MKTGLFLYCLFCAAIEDKEKFFTKNTKDFEKNIDKLS